MSATPALLAASAGVGFGHAILPDHWVPLAVVGRTRRYPLSKVARLSGLAGIAHVAISLVLGGLIIAIGLQFRSTVEHAQNAIVGGVLLATGLALLALELSGRGHTHDRTHGPTHERHHRHKHTRGHSGERDLDATATDNRPGRLRGLASIMVPFGAAASPDLTILPVFIAAAATGAGAAIGSLLVFALSTIATIVGLTLLATAGGYQLRSRTLDRWGNAITAVVLTVIGALVLTGAI
jgi:threonine/homoserine/homoserine lactone efflux protein